MRAFVGRIQEIAMEENGGHPMIYGTDAAHGNALMTDGVFRPADQRCRLIQPRPCVRAGSHYCS
ncbi:hypothetical protein PR003_g21184 [Phytophthora rubi]|uniref:Glycoside hydrolase family 3 N-terminal domain-containing protein n=1 Tax=Phytophthora rubi TaxID=129364 RepID=A0A6A4DDU8_9STRA|nr:hypothetical protein PR003_g21184 [Phytophthora rubi]